MPALLLQTVAVRTRPAEGEPLLLEQLREDDVAVLYDLDFDRHRFRVHDAANVGGPASETPQRSRARLDGVNRQVAARPFSRRPSSLEFPEI